MSETQTIASLLEEKNLIEVRLQDIATFIYKPTTTHSQIIAYTMQYQMIDSNLCKLRRKIRELQKAK